MSKDKYTRIFLRQIEAIVYLSSIIFATRGESVYEQFIVYYGCSLFSVRWYNCMNTKHVLPSVTTTKRSLILN